MAGYIGTKAAVVTPGAERKKVFSITTTTSSLTGLAYIPGFVHVFHNGVRLVDGTDYTATNGTSLTLTTAAQNGDEVVVISYATFEVADAYTKAESDDRYVNVTGDTMTGSFGVGSGVSNRLALEYNAISGLATFGPNSAGGSTSLSVGTSDAGSFVSRMNITSTGNVGIGTSSPEARLHVVSGSTLVASVNGTNAAGGYMVWRQNGTVIADLGITQQIFGTGGTDTFGINGRGARSLVFGTNNIERVRIDTAGRVTMPYQPMFSAFNLATASQYPISYSTWATFDSNLTNFDSPRYAAETNIGSHYSTSNGRFTAPVAGRYLISLNVSMWVGNTSYITFFKNGANTSPYQLAYNADLGAYQSMTIVRVITLAAGDYVEPGFYASSGTYATFIPGGGYIQFSGHLIG